MFVDAFTTSLARKTSFTSSWYCVCWVQCMSPRYLSVSRVYKSKLSTSSVDGVKFAWKPWDAHPPLLWARKLLSSPPHRVNSAGRTAWILWVWTNLAGSKWNWLSRMQVCFLWTLCLANTEQALFASLKVKEKLWVPWNTRVPGQQWHFQSH